MKRPLFLGVLGLSTGIAIMAACGGDDETSLLTDSDAGGSETPDGGVGSPFAASGVIIVHGAALPPLRLCFESNLEQLPIPMDTFLPSANIVGLPTGGIVRVASVPLGAGRVLAYDDTALSPLYPPGLDGPPCSALAQTAVPLFDLGTIGNAQDAGVSLMVISGCQASSADPDASAAACGDDWSPDTGNLAVRMTPITPYSRPEANALPLQVVQLSPGFDRLTRGQVVSVAFGDLDGGTATIISQPLEAGAPTPDSPIAITYAPADTAAYATTGFAISFDAASPAANTAAPDAGDAGDAGDVAPPPTTNVPVGLAQSLADIVARSSPRDVPPGWLGTSSSYALLIVGDPNATSGPTQLHFVIAPVAVPDQDRDAGSAR